MEAHICERCGGALEKKEGGYVCPYCRATYEDDAEERASVTLKGLLDAEKLERLSNARRLLYDAAHRPNPSHKKVSTAAHDVLIIYPDDVLARFYEAAHDDDPAVLNEFLLETQTELPNAEEIVRWMLRSLESRNVTALKTFVERHFKGDMRRRNEIWAKIEDEAEKLDNGLYDASATRDVFVAYSSADQNDVVKVVDYLESSGFTCFVAYRNLRHGRGAQESYLNALYDAIKHCKVLVFLSSDNSRSLNCDAMKVELRFINDNRKQLSIQCIEYVLNEPSKKLAGPVGNLLREVFYGQEWCNNLDDLANWVLNKTSQTSLICPNCALVNLPGARFCSACGHPLDPHAAQQQKDKHLAEDVMATINAIGEIELTPSCKGRIDAARAAYDALSAEAKNMVGNTSVLVAAESKYAELKKAHDAEAANTLVCPECGTRNPKGAKFCSSCGHAFGGSRRTPRPQPEPEPEPEPAPHGDSTNVGGFEIQGHKLIKYTGSDEEVRLPETVTEIGPEAFADQKGIKHLYIGAQVTMVGKEAFRKMRAFVHFALSQDAFNSVSKSWDKEWKHLFSGILDFGNAGAVVKPRHDDRPAPEPHDGGPKPQGFEIEGTKLIKYTGTEETVTVPDYITEIASEAFADQEEIKHIYIGPNVTKIGGDAFREVHAFVHFAMKKDIFDGYAKDWGREWKHLFHGILDWGSAVPSGGSSTSGSTSKPPRPSGNGFEIQGHKLIKYTGSDEEVRLPETVTEIGPEAFADQKGIKHLYIGAQVTMVGKEAFRKMRAFVHFALSQDAFNAVSKSWDKEWKHLFSGILDFGTAGAPTTARTSTTRTTTTSTTRSSGGNVMVWDGTSAQPKAMKPTPSSEFDIEGGVLKGFHGSSATIVIPAEVNEIAEGAFRFSSVINKVYVHEGVTKIGPSAFRGSPSLTEVYLPKGLKVIDEFTFNNCPELKRVNLPQQLTEVGRWAFRGCSSLGEIRLPNTVTKIGDWAFSGMSSARLIEVSPNVKEVGDYAFKDTGGTVHFNMPSSTFTTRKRSFESSWQDGFRGKVTNG